MVNSGNRLDLVDLSLTLWQHGAVKFVRLRQGVFCGIKY